MKNKKLIEIKTFVLAYLWFSLSTIALVVINPRLSAVTMIPIIEELLKYTPLYLLWDYLDKKIYIFAMAIFWTTIEFAAVFPVLVASEEWYYLLVLRLIPHLLFAGIFYLIQKRSKWLALPASTISHVGWNTVISLTFK